MLYDSDIISTVGSMTGEIEFSMKKWDKYYSNESIQTENEKTYTESTLPLILKQIFEHADHIRGETKTFLEIGCGRSFLGEKMARLGWLFIGIDYSLDTLRMVKKRLDNRSIDNYILIHGDVTELPIRSGTIDYIYGGGVISHFRNTQSAVDHIFRVLKKDGVSFNSVPYLNIGGILYRSMTGSVPNIPIVKQVAEFINFRLLRGKHMRFGYDLQFTAGQMKKNHVNAGFKPENIVIERFEHTVVLEIVKNKFLRTFFTHLIKTNRHFWQMVKVIGIKDLSLS